MHFLKYLFCGWKGVTWAVDILVYSCVINDQTWLSCGRVYVGSWNEGTVADKLSSVFNPLNDDHIDHLLNDLVCLGFNVDR